MVNRLDPGALLARSYPLARGPRVCLRLLRSRDRAGIERLLQAQGGPGDQLEPMRLLRADPRHTIVICATALIDSAETLVGVGAIEVDRTAEPELLVVDDTLTEGLDELLAEALCGRARALSLARAA